MNIPSLFEEFNDTSRFQLLLRDIVAECIPSIHGIKVPYVQKYPEIINYAQIIEARGFIQQMSEVMLELNRYEETEVNKLVEKLKGTMNEEKYSIIQNVLMSNYQGLVQKALYESIAMSKYILKDYNWNINLTISSDKISKCRKPTLLLELLLDTFDESRTSKKIIFEMNKEELEVFLTKLQQIKLL